MTKKIFITAVLAQMIWSTTSFARLGSEGVGGGEPLALEFLATARLIQNAQHAGKIHLGVSDLVLRTKIDEIEKSLEGQNPLVVFKPGRRIKCMGVDKLGCVNEKGIIEFAERGWSKGTERAKVEVVTMELVKVLDGKNRYPIADSVSRTLEYQRTSSPMDLVGTDYDKKSIRALFGRDCQVPIINRALFMASQSGYYVRFEPNSYEFEDDEDPEGKYSDIYLKQIVNVSSIELYGRGAFKKGDRVAWHSYYKTQDQDDDEVDRCREVVREKSFSWPVNEPAPKDLVTAAEGADKFFGTCEREVLNAAIERVANDKEFNRLAGDWPHVEYLSAYKLMSKGRQSYIVNLQGSAAFMSMPFSFRLETKQVGDECRITDIRSR